MLKSAIYEYSLNKSYVSQLLSTNLEKAEKNAEKNPEENKK